MASLDHALTQLQASGRVSLPGKRSTRTRVLTVLFSILIGLTALITVGMIGFGIYVMSTGVFVNPIGLGAPVMSGVGCFVLIMVLRKQRRASAAELLNITLEPAGITMRGIGPIPWHEVAPPTFAMVRAQYDSAFERRAVLPLTAVGITNVNRLLPPDTRRALGPRTGGLLTGGARTEALYVPAADGLSTDDTMHLFATAHQMFAAVPHA